MKYLVVKQSCFVAVLVITLFSCIKKEVVQVPVEHETDADTTSPIITGFTPDVSWYGNTVTISGTGFSKLASKVWVGATPAEITTATETSLTIKINQAMHDGYIHVQVNGREAISSTVLTINQLAWKKQIGGSADEMARYILPIPGGYLVSGFTNSTDGDIKQGHGGLDMWVARLDSGRNIIWQQLIGGSNHEEAGPIVPTSDGAYVVTGYSYSKDGDMAGGPGGSTDPDAWAIKFTKDGAIQWKKPFGGTGIDVAYAIAPTTDGGCVIAGYTTSNNITGTNFHGGEDLWVTKLNTNGGIVWQKTLGGSKLEGAADIVSTPDGGCMIAGYTNSTDGDITGKHNDYDIWVTKLNANGTLVGQKALGGSEGDYGYTLALTADGGCVVAGSTRSNDGDVTNGGYGSDDIWIVKLNAGNGISWQKIIGGSDHEHPVSIIPATDGGYVLAATTFSNDGDMGNNHGHQDIWIAKLNSNRNITGKRMLGGSDDEIAYSMAATPDNGYVVAGFATSTDGDIQNNHGGEDMWLFKIWQ
jgi:hypothetical protein